MHTVRQRGAAEERVQAGRVYPQTKLNKPV